MNFIITSRLNQLRSEKNGLFTQHSTNCAIGAILFSCAANLSSCISPENHSQ